MQIQLSKLTPMEQAFVKAGVNEFNDLMFADDLNHGIAKGSLGGVVSSLIKKGIIIVYEDHSNCFEFVGDDGYGNNEEPPELV